MFTTYRAKGGADAALQGLIFLVIITLLLTACAAAPPPPPPPPPPPRPVMWFKPGATEETFRVDKAACAYDIATSRLSASAAFVFDMCLQAKGYKKEGS